MKEREIYIYYNHSIPWVYTSKKQWLGGSQIPFNPLTSHSIPISKSHYIPLNPMNPLVIYSHESFGYIYNMGSWAHKQTAAVLFHKPGLSWHLGPPPTGPLCISFLDRWRFRKSWGFPPNHPNLDHFSIETHGDAIGSPHFQKGAYNPMALHSFGHGPWDCNSCN